MAQMKYDNEGGAALTIECRYKTQLDRVCVHHLEWWNIELLSHNEFSCLKLKRCLNLYYTKARF